VAVEWYKKYLGFPLYQRGMAKDMEVFSKWRIQKLWAAYN
jgi:hypothetical protein